jgi:hypothetical protein
MDCALLARDLGIASGLRQKAGPLEVNFGGSAPVAVINGLGCPRHDDDPVNRNGAGFLWLGLS